jgi:hypothetical protein
MTENLVAFSIWLDYFIAEIYQWEKENNKKYTTENASTELNMLAGLFEAKVTAKEAARIYTTTQTREMSLEHYKVFMCATFLKWCKETNGEIIALIAKEVDGKPALVKGPRITYHEFLKLGVEVIEELVKALQGSKNRKA